uniref:Putative ovule protein n=1 Tax=Solanum chacoense TaxID=4108 RepID=A0A0V0H0Q3_SOLCH
MKKLVNNILRVAKGKLFRSCSIKELPLSPPILGVKAEVDGVEVMGSAEQTEEMLSKQSSRRPKNTELLRMAG